VIRLPLSISLAYSASSVQHFLSLPAQDKVLNWLQDDGYIHLTFHPLCGLGYANCVSPVVYAHQTDDCPSQLLGSSYFLSFEVNVNVHLQVLYELVGSSHSLCEHLSLVGEAPVASIPQDQIQVDPPWLVRIQFLVSYLGTE